MSILLCGMLWWPSPASAQSDTAATAPLSSLKHIQEDTLRMSVRDSALFAPRIDTAHAAVPAGKSSATAMLLSAVLPGAGQVYNQSYWKAPIVMGLGVYFASVWLDQNRRYHDYRDKATASEQAADASSPPDPLSTSLADYYRRIRDFYKQQRDTFAWYYFILYFANILDAYVDANLSGFNVGGDLSLRVVPEQVAVPIPHRQVGIQLNFRP